MKAYILLAAFFAALHPGAHAQQALLVAKEVYRCTPCNNPACDTLLFDHPGTCPVCHMPLIKKLNGVGAAQINTDFAGHWEGSAGTTDQQLKFSLVIAISPAKVLFTAADLNAMDVAGSNVGFNADSIHFELIGDDGVMELNGVLKNGKISGTFATNDQSVAIKNRSGTFELQKATATRVSYTIREVTFRNGDVVLAGSLYLPTGMGKFPAVVCNHSSGDKPRYDGAFIADYLAKRRVAVLIYDKRGDGQSTGDWRASTFEDLADDCIAGVNLLKSEPKINHKLIGIFGHSQGGTISPIIIGRCPDIAFNVAAAAFAVSPPEQDIFRVTNILKHEAHLSDAAADSAIRFYKIWLEVARTGKGWDEMEKVNNEVKNAAWYAWVEPPPANSWPWKWYLSAGNYNYVPYWEKVKIPTLLIYGENDEITPVKPSVINIEAALKKAGNRRYKLIIMPNAIHYFAQVKKEGDLWTQSTPGYFENIYQWIAAACSMQRGGRESN